MISIVFILLLALTGAQASGTSVEDGNGDAPAMVIIEYFYQPGCAECELISKFTIPSLDDRYSGRYRLTQFDIGKKENFIRLAYYQEKLGITANEPVCMILNRKYPFNGYKEIERGMPAKINEILSNGEEPAKDEYAPANARKIMEGRSGKITVAAVSAAGLVDGINPCVFSTLVFFMSVLAVSGVKGRRLLFFGLIYCLTCFITYFLLGLGILRFIKIFYGYEMMRTILNRGMFAVLLVFAIISFRDAWIFRKTGNAGGVLLQLPESLKKRIHNIIKKGTHFRYLATGALVTGFLVTLIESVCTGQVYVPALALMAKQDASSLKWIFYLLLYNVMFIIPLIAVFAAAYLGTGLATMRNWSKRDVVIGKIAMGIFFVILAVIMLLV